jgi:hypothetical protein
MREIGSVCSGFSVKNVTQTFAAHGRLVEVSMKKPPKSLQNWR